MPWDGLSVQIWGSVEERVRGQKRRERMREFKKEERTSGGERGERGRVRGEKEGERGVKRKRDGLIASC